MIVTLTDRRKVMSLSKAKGRLKQVINTLLPRRQCPAPETIPRVQDEWSIGIYVGESPFDIASPENVSNPVLTRDDVSDAQATFVADPFMLKTHDTWHLFFEVMNRQTRKGEIGLAS